MALDCDRAGLRSRGPISTAPHTVHTVARHSARQAARMALPAPTMGDSGDDCEDSVKNMLPEEIIEAMLNNSYAMPMQMGDSIRSIVKNAVEAGYAAGCEEAARIVESKSVPLGYERRYFAKAIRDWCRQIVKPL